MDFRRFFRYLSFLPIFVISLLNIDCTSAKVRVKIYDHRAYHDPIHWYGKGPWKYFGHGYGIDYGYDHDGNHSHEKGYGFVKAFAREFCKDGYKCRPPDPNFWKMTSLSANGISAEPYFGHPPADVVEPRIPQLLPTFPTPPDEPSSEVSPEVSEPFYIADDSNLINLKTLFHTNRYNLR